jgi:arsenite methyltransferase
VQFANFRFYRGQILLRVALIVRFCYNLNVRFHINCGYASLTCNFLCPIQVLLLKDKGSAMETGQIHDALRTRYAKAAEQPVGQFNYPVGRGSAEHFDYLSEMMELVPANVVDRFIGVGNPFSLGEPEVGWHVVDIGCGAGFDAQIAAQFVGTPGHVIAVDMCPEMLAVANTSYKESPLENISFSEGFAESLPVEDEWADLVISNGVLNLAACKTSAFAEIARVLRSGGRFQATDLVLVKRLPDDLRKDEYAWSN